jgi:hypothetical protein
MAAHYQLASDEYLRGLKIDETGGDHSEAIAHYWRAVEEFRKSYELEPRPRILFALGQAYRKLGEFERALRAYRGYLAEVPNGVWKQEAAQHVQELEAILTHQRATEAAPPPGVPPPSVEEAGPREEVTNGNKPAGSVPPTVDLQPQRGSGALSPPAYVDVGKPMRVAGVVTADVGVGLVALGVVFAMLSKHAGDAAYHPSSGVYDDVADQRQANFRVADITCFVVGGTAVITGTTLWLLGRRARRRSHATSAHALSGGTIAVRF